MKRVASVFKGVHASEFLHYLLRNQSSFLCDLFIECLSDEDDLAAVREEIRRILTSKSAKGADAKALSSVLSWPSEFFEALQEAYAHSAVIEHVHGPEAGTSLGKDLGIDEDILHDLALLRRVSAKKSKTKTGLSFDAAIDIVAKTIRTVLNKIPAAHRDRLEGISFAATQALYESLGTKVDAGHMDDPSQNFQHRVDAYIREYASYNYDLDLGLADALVTKLSTNTLGQYVVKSNLIVIYELSVKTIAHELGHAIWEYAYSPRALQGFLVATSMQAGNRARTAREFVDHLATALNGLELREDDRKLMVKKLHETWGEEYEANFRGDRDVNHMKKLIRAKSTQDLVKRFIARSDRNHFLASWSEAWAEGFAEALLPDYRSEKMHVPGVIKSLIHHLLSLGAQRAN